MATSVLSITWFITTAGHNASALVKAIEGLNAWIQASNLHCLWSVLRVSHVMLHLFLSFFHLASRVQVLYRWYGYEEKKGVPSKGSNRTLNKTIKNETKMKWSWPSPRIISQ